MIKISFHVHTDLLNFSLLVLAAIVLWWNIQFYARKEGVYLFGNTKEHCILAPFLA